MQTDKASLKDKWKKKREEAYEGSVMHFMRSFYKNSLAEDGFEVKGLATEPNIEKQRVKKLFKYAEVNKTDGTIIAESNNNKDSLTYYRKIMAQPDELITDDKLMYSNRKIAYRIDEITMGLRFNGSLSVTYLNKWEPYAYVEQTDKTKTITNISSKISLQNNTFVKVMENGSYFHPSDLLIQGFWSWSEKLGNLLPYDYQVDSKK